MIDAPAIRKWLSIGTGAGLEIDGDVLHVTVLRVRPGSLKVVAAESFAGFRERPAAEWGSEIAAFLKRSGAPDKPLMVVLPPGESLSRTISLAGVSKRELGSAVELQLDGIQPFGEGAAANGWAPLDDKGAVLVGIAREETVDGYSVLFAEAGLALAGFTSAPAAIRSAMLFHPKRPEQFLAVRSTETDVRLYGESRSAPVFWAAMEMPLERAIPFARAQMRLPEEAPNEDLNERLPGESISGAAALMSACPWLAVDLNLLPDAQRSARSRWMFVPTAVLACLLAAAGVAFANLERFEDKRLMDGLNQQSARYSDAARRASEAERERVAVEQRIAQLKEFRQRNRKDLDALIEATRLIAPPAWSSRLDLTRSAIAISGEASNAAELPRILDASPLFRNSEFLSPLSRSKTSPMDAFNVRALREEPAPAKPDAPKPPPPEQKK